MCGRVAQAEVKDRLTARFTSLDFPEDFQPRYNIAPTQPLMVLKQDKDRLQATMMRWGLVPSWWRDAARLPDLTFNARAETLAEKPTFRSAFKKRRCIIPVDGFYEWMSVLGKKTKQPMYICPKDPEGVFLLAGLWEYWESPDGALESCTVITTEPNSFMGDIHNRMPLILSPKDSEEWLNPVNRNMAGLVRLMAPCDPSSMDAYAVAPIMGDGPRLLDRMW